MASKFFGSNASTATGIAGAAGGFLSGGLLGGGIGLLSGLFGGNDAEQTTTYNYSNLSSSQKALNRSAEGVLGQLLKSLAPGEQEAFISELTGELQGVARTDVADTFGKARAEQGANQARSGGRLASVAGVNDAAMGRAEGKTLTEALLGARLGAEEIGASHYSQNVAGANSAMGAITGLDSTRKLLSSTGTQSTNHLDDLLGGAMGALSNPLSAFNAGEFSEGSIMSKLGGGKYNELLTKILEG